jgi:hypothetical protein
MRNKGRDLFCCSACGKYRRKKRISRRGTLSWDRRGRCRIWLGKGHELANSGGWQWLSRYLVMADLGRRLRRDEHVHHEDENFKNDAAWNLRVLLAEYHGRLHGLKTVLYRKRDPLGRFLPVEAPETRWWPRAGAVLGPAACT